MAKKHTDTNTGRNRQHEKTATHRRDKKFRQGASATANK
jgi:hypothetical protein